MRRILRFEKARDAAMANTNHESRNPQSTLSPPVLKGSPSVHLDALRAFAAFSVLLNHWRDALFFDYQQIGKHNPVVGAAYFVTGLGHQWVIVFFVMSGYLVGGSVLRAVATQRWSWRVYLLTRLTRLYTVLLPALVLGGAIDWTGMHLAGASELYSGHSGMHALSFNVYSTLNLSTLTANGLFLQTIALPGSNGRQVPAFGSNGALWSLSNEFWYYLAFPLVVLMLAKDKPLKVRVVCGLGLVAWGWFVGAGIALLGIPWLMGVLIRFLPPLQVRRPWVSGSFTIAALVLFSGALAMGKAWPSLGTDLLVGLVVSFMVWVTLHYATTPVHAAYECVAQRSARSSYTLYLVHLPLLIFLKASFHLPRASPGWLSGLVGLGILACILIYAQLVYEVFEKHTDQIRNWIKPHLFANSTA
jgi:peptidoglycan/LPS O-acetylase OafA/YrhL